MMYLGGMGLKYIMRPLIQYLATLAKFYVKYR